MRRTLSLAVAAGGLAVLVACGGDGSTGPTVLTTPPPSPTPAPTPTPAATPTPAPNASLIGVWRLVTSSGVDVSALNGTFTVTATTIREEYPGLCGKSYDYTISGGNTLNTVVTSNSCTFPGSNEPVGFRGTSLFNISGNTLTITVPATGAVGVLVRVS